MKIVYKALNEGFEQCIVPNDFEVSEPYTEIEPPQPNWRPVFNFKTERWVEKATEEEMERPEVGPTDLETISQLISDLEIAKIEEELINEQREQNVTDLEIRVIELENGGK